MDRSTATRHQDAASSAGTKAINLRQRSQTVRPKTTYFSDEIDGGGSPATLTSYSSGDHVISYPQLVSQPPKPKPVKEKEKKRIIRSSTFRNKDKDKDKKEEKEKLAGSMGSSQGNHSDENSARSEELYMSCITALKTSLEEIMVRSIM